MWFGRSRASFNLKLIKWSCHSYGPKTRLSALSPSHLTLPTAISCGKEKDTECSNLFKIIQYLLFFSFFFFLFNTLCSPIGSRKGDFSTPKLDFLPHLLEDIKPQTLQAEKGKVYTCIGNLANEVLTPGRTESRAGDKVQVENLDCFSWFFEWKLWTHYFVSSSSSKNSRYTQDQM